MRKVNKLRSCDRCTGLHSHRFGDADAEVLDVLRAEGALAVALGARQHHSAFRRLHILHPQDPALGNNFAFFAALTEHDQRLALEVARGNLAADPKNLTYLATHGFVVLMGGRAEDALRELQPHASEAAHNPGFAFAYGMALAANGQREAARLMLLTLPPTSLTRLEVDLIHQRLLEN